MPWGGGGSGVLLRGGSCSLPTGVGILAGWMSVDQDDVLDHVPWHWSWRKIHIVSLQVGEKAGGLTARPAAGVQKHVQGECYGLVTGPH
jgi:hypothetical protein